MLAFVVFCHKIRPKLAGFHRLYEACDNATSILYVNDKRNAFRSVQRAFKKMGENGIPSEHEWLDHGHLRRGLMPQINGRYVWIKEKYENAEQYAECWVRQASRMKDNQEEDPKHFLEFERTLDYRMKVMACFLEKCRAIIKRNQRMEDRA